MIRQKLIVTPRHRCAGLLAAAATAVALLACSTAPPVGQGAVPTPGTSWAPGRDLRPAFRRVLCQQLAAETDCSQVLRRLPDERAATGAGPTPLASATELARRYRLVFVPGLLSGCAGSLVAPFQDVADALRGQGFDVHILSVEGRGSTEHNAELIAEQLSSAAADPRPQIVFGYSKGLPDVMEALVQHPHATRQVAAVVSWAGAVGGTPLADDMSGLEKTLLEHLPLATCPAGDGSELESLRRGVRHSWWQANHLRLHVPFYSLVALPDPGHISVPLRGTSAQLAHFDVNNDGQLAANDAIVPGSALLGYVNADHWAIAIALSRQLPLLRGLFVDDVPRAALALAAITVIHQQASHPRP